MNAHKELLINLIAIRDDTNRNDYVGICWHLQDDEQQYIFNSLCKEWPEYSGVKDYPVPSVTPSYSPQDEYKASTNQVYKGEYGALRLDLVDFCIDKLENGYEC